MLDSIFTETPHVKFTSKEIRKISKLCEGGELNFDTVGNFWCEDFNLEIVKRGGGVKIFKYDSDSGLCISYGVIDETVTQSLNHIEEHFPRWFSKWNPQLF